MRKPTPPPQGDADTAPREFVTVHPDGTKSHGVKRGHRGAPLPPPRSNGKYAAVLQDMGQGTSPPRRSWAKLKLGGA